MSNSYIFGLKPRLKGDLISQQNNTDHRQFYPVQVTVSNSEKRDRNGYILLVEICPFDLDPEYLPKNRRRPDPIPETTSTAPQTTSSSTPSTTTHSFRKAFEIAGEVVG